MMVGGLEEVFLMMLMFGGPQGTCYSPRDGYGTGV